MIPMKRTRVLASLLVLVAAACGSDGDSSSDTAEDAEAGVETPESTSGDGSGDASDEGSGDASDDGAAEGSPDAPSAGGGATLTLANGETFEFANVLCTLEPQISAGSEILFTAVSYDDPGLDITQFGEEAAVPGLASISVYDGAFETLWEANTALGAGVELTLDGSTIRGTGSFYEGEDFGGDTVEGEVVANC
jgi:hypothetical protein